MALGSTPYITFDIHHDKIIVESNEDGFMFQNVEAICKTGESSKVGRPGYIGAKGIGFKSVFMVASKVYIQSRAYSFYFEYEGDKNEGRANDGIRMITPVTCPLDPNPRRILTRMTLMLRRSIQFSTLLQQFEDLHNILLLFLKKPKKISIQLHNPSNGESDITTYAFQEDETLY